MLPPNIEVAKCCPYLSWELLNPITVRKHVNPFFDDLDPDAIHDKRNDWQTPPEIIEAVIYSLGKIDLDPASCPEANARIHAIQSRILGTDYPPHFFTEQVNGLIYPWKGRIILNPPYSTKLLKKFITKANDEYKLRNIEAAVIITNLQSLPSFSSGGILMKNAIVHAILDGRPKFLAPNRTNPDTGRRISFGSPKHGTICSYFGDHPELFIKAFEKLSSFIVPNPSMWEFKKGIFRRTK